MFSRRPGSRFNRGRVSVVSGATLYPATLADLEFWVRGDDADVVLNGSNVESVPNQGALGGLARNTTAANQPLYNATVLDFDGGDILPSTIAASSYQFGHDGTGMTCAFIYKHDDTSTFQRCNATMNANTAGFSFDLAANGTDGRSLVAFRVDNATGQDVAALTHDYGVNPSGVWHTLIATYSTAAGSELWADGVSVASAAEAFTPAATAPTNTFGWGGVTAGSFRGVMPEVILCSRVLSDTEIGLLHTYLTRWSA